LDTKISKINADLESIQQATSKQTK
jgi:hypothetical protein